MFLILGWEICIYLIGGEVTVILLRNLISDEKITTHDCDDPVGIYP